MVESVQSRLAALADEEAHTAACYHRRGLADLAAAPPDRGRIGVSARQLIPEEENNRK
jgi:hypothetical protein